MEEKVMQIVKEICNTETNCRGLANNQKNIDALLNLKGIDISNIRVYEMPLNWSDQVVILYENKANNEHRELFAGIGTDGNFYFDDEIQEEY